MLEMFRDFYGCHATIRNFQNGSCRLTVRRRDGRLFHSKNYSSRRGARIAMGRMSDGWQKL